MAVAVVVVVMVLAVVSNLQRRVVVNKKYASPSMFFERKNDARHMLR